MLSDFFFLFMEVLGCHSCSLKIVWLKDLLYCCFLIHIFFQLPCDILQKDLHFEKFHFTFHRTLHFILFCIAEVLGCHAFVC